MLPFDRSPVKEIPPCDRVHAKYYVQLVALVGVDFRHGVAVYPTGFQAQYEIAYSYGIKTSKVSIAMQNVFINPVSKLMTMVDKAVIEYEIFQY